MHPSDFISKPPDGVVILPDSASVRRKVKAVFSTKGRKVAVVAFVGQDAETYLGKYLRGTEIYCWPRAGGTNPHAIQDLRSKFGCKVYFANKLHMKIFWSRDRGCVIGSANLTNNALGENGLKEAGVFLDDSSLVKVDQIIKSIGAHLVTDVAVRKLIEEHKSYYAKNRPRHARKRARSFLDWYNSTPRESWKLGWFCEAAEFSKTANQIARKQYGLKEPEDFLYAEKISFDETDWVLVYKLHEDGCPIYSSSIAWLYVERLVRTNEEPDWPYEAIQFRPTKHFASPPFRIDPKFRKAFQAVGEELGARTMMPVKNCTPPKRLIDGLARLCRK